jgi:hypothetical protein
MRNLRRHVLKSRQRALRREAFAVDEPVTDGEAERERGVAEMWRELVPFLETQTSAISKPSVVTRALGLMVSKSFMVFAG